VPDEVFRLAQLEVLNLAGNRITQLDARIGRLKKLRVLDLSQNQLTSVDANVLH
jgi:Leucine-rich repeat (LRR) protein